VSIDRLVDKFEKIWKELVVATFYAWGDVMTT
jgi:hypothetical protein